MLILDSSLPKPRGRGQSFNRGGVARNLTVSVEKLDIESDKNAKSMKFCIISEFKSCTILGIFMGNICIEYFRVRCLKCQQKYIPEYLCRIFMNYKICRIG